MGVILYMAVLIGLMWFLLIRPQQQQAKKRAEMLNSLKTGDKVSTIGGLCGTIKALTENKVYLEIADGLTVEVLRSAIGQLDKAGDEEYEDDEYEDDDEYEEEYEDDDDLYYDDEDEDDYIEVENKKK